MKLNITLSALALALAISECLPGAVSGIRNEYFFCWGEEDTGVVGIRRTDSAAFCRWWISYWRWRPTHAYLMIRYTHSHHNISISFQFYFLDGGGSSTSTCSWQPLPTHWDRPTRATDNTWRWRPHSQVEGIKIKN